MKATQMPDVGSNINSTSFSREWPAARKKKELLFPVKGNKKPVFKSLRQINDLHLRAQKDVGYITTCIAS